MTEVEEGRLLETVEQLTMAVSKLTTQVELLVGRQNYWQGAVAMLVLLSGGIGAAFATLVQWFHK